MRRLMILLIFILLIPRTAYAADYDLPELPESAEEYMPADTESFVEGLWYVIKSAIGNMQPIISQAAAQCLSCICIILFCSITQGISGNAKSAVLLVSTVLISVVLLQPANSLIRISSQTIHEMTDYGNLLLPILTGTLASQGAIGTSTALYAGTALFVGLLNKLISVLIIPLIYIYSCLCVCCCALQQPLLEELKKFVKWLIVWLLKTVLYVFIGYMGITGVVSGTADAAAVRAAKLTISGVVPVVGGIIADASETILVSAGLVKSSVGVYGMLAFISILIGPFLKIGIPYLMLKGTGSVCMIFGVKESSKLIQDFAGAMGMILAMCGTVALLLMISTVCFMRGIS